MKWWKENELRSIPLITFLVCKYLAIPATSAPSDHVFSLAGGVCNWRRVSLTPENLNAVMLLNANRDLL